MKKALLSLTLAFLLFGAQKTLAGVAQFVERLNEQDRMTYYATVAMCEQGATRAYAEKSSLWVSSFVNSGIITSLASQTNPLKTSAKLNSLTSSQGFHLALTKCFGNNQDQKSLFFLSLLSLDISGKFASWATEITLMKALYFGVKTIHAAGFAVVPMRWMWFKVVFGLIMSKPLLWKITPTKLLLGVFTAETASDLYLKYAQARDQMNLMTGNTQEKIELLQEEIAYFQSQIQRTSNQDEIELYRLFIRQNEDSLRETRLGQRSYRS